MNATKWNTAFQPKEDTGESFSTKLKSTSKNSGTFQGKKNNCQLRQYCTKSFNLEREQVCS